MGTPYREDELLLIEARGARRAVAAEAGKFPAINTQRTTARIRKWLGRELIIVLPIWTAFAFLKPISSWEIDSRRFTSLNAIDNLSYSLLSRKGPFISTFVLL